VVGAPLHFIYREIASDIFFYQLVKTIDYRSTKPIFYFVCKIFFAIILNYYPITSLKELKKVLKMSHGRNECRIYVGNLPPDIRNKDIQDLFHKFGKVTFVDLKNRRGPPFAFVEFEDNR
jgi:hypothetical protein